MSQKRKSPARRSNSQEEMLPSRPQVKYWNPPAHWQPTNQFHFNPAGQQPTVMTDPAGRIINSVRGNNKPGEVWMVLR